MRPRVELLAITVLFAFFAGACLGDGNGVEVIAPEDESAVEAQIDTASSTTLADSVATTTIYEGPVAPFTGLPAASPAAASRFCVCSEDWQ